MSRYKKSPDYKKHCAKSISPGKRKPRAKNKSPSKRKPRAKTKSPSKRKPRAKNKSPSKRKPRAKNKSPSKSKFLKKKHLKNYIVHNVNCSDDRIFVCEYEDEQDPEQFNYQVNKVINDAMETKYDHKLTEYLDRKFNPVMDTELFDGGEYVLYHVSNRYDLHNTGIKSYAKQKYDGDFKDDDIESNGLTSSDPFNDMCFLAKELSECAIYYQALKRLSILVVEQNKVDLVAETINNQKNRYVYKIHFPLRENTLIYEDQEWRDKGFYGFYRVLLFNDDFKISSNNYIEQFEYDQPHSDVEENGSLNFLEQVLLNSDSDSSEFTNDSQLDIDEFPSDVDLSQTALSQ